MTVFQVIRHIIIPQAFMASLPNLCNMFISLLHGSSLAFWISLIEMTGEANIIAANNLKFFESFVAAAFIYWSISIVIEQIESLFELRMRKYSTGGIL